LSEKSRKIGRALVVGGGISGIRSALDLAEFGYGVTLIDRADHLGGILSQLDHQFPTDRCGMCKMLPLVDRDAASQYCLRKGLFHENIEIRLGTEMIAVEGDPGAFQVTLRQKAGWVDPDRCVGCGLCAEVCPVEVPDPFNEGLSTRKAIYLPTPHTIPNPYRIDTVACTRCGECERVCPTDAIRISGEDRRGFRILVVDDELIVRDSLKEWLDEEGGFSVDTAGSGEEALEKLDANDYQLMLLDIKMPGTDGVTVLERAAGAHPDLIVVMMTAYATVETAVEAMKIGALDYLIKPFDPDALIPKVVEIYEQQETSRLPRIEVGAIVLSGGNTYYNPADGKNTYGYRQIPDVVTGLEFERMLNHAGPFAGKLQRPSDGGPVEKIAWIQCVGSRDLQSDADFCSNVCCMYAVKEARLAQDWAKQTGATIETTIYYMDMRTFGKSHQRYRDEAEAQWGVRFRRGRIHSVIADHNGEGVRFLFMDDEGERHLERCDLVVLSVGQRPAPGTATLAEMMSLTVNPWGFVRPAPLSLTDTERAGIVMAGGFSGLKEIGDAVTEASAAALSASRTIHGAGGGLAPTESAQVERRDISREPPRTLVALCTCGNDLAPAMDGRDLEGRLSRDPSVAGTVRIQRVCTAEGWGELEAAVDAKRPNRILVGACLPYVYNRKIRALADRAGLDPGLADVVDLRTPAFYETTGDDSGDGVTAADVGARMEGALRTGLARLRRVSPNPAPTVPVFQRALVVGGGIAGMTAALAIADHGFPVDLVERDAELGGNLRWIRRTLDGREIKPLLEETADRVEKHPSITIHTETQVTGGAGSVGRFHTTLEGPDGAVETIEHGAAVIATGGGEVPGTEVGFGYGESDRVITQRELEIGLADGSVDPSTLETVVMIGCAGTRKEPRNYCSRVCCATALKHAVELKEAQPDLAVYMLYRDMMSYGFTETYFTEARRKGIIFIAYPADTPPGVTVDGSGVRVGARDPVLGREVEIAADLLVLAAGVTPALPVDLAAAFGVPTDIDGFFHEADSKWRPVDALREGVFACGLAHSPRNIPESIATAAAAAQRALRLLARRELPAGRVVAEVRESLCALCERCIETCPYGARSLSAEGDRVEVDPAMCQGCGACAAICPNSASYVEGFAFDQMLEIIDAALV
jgi:heterodisulfide reductase subunit A2